MPAKSRVPRRIRSFMHKNQTEGEKNPFIFFPFEPRKYFLGTNTCFVMTCKGRSIGPKVFWRAFHELSSILLFTSYEETFFLTSISFYPSNGSFVI